MVKFQLGWKVIHRPNLREQNCVHCPLTLKGKANEAETYECRWQNSRGEVRHRQFEVSVKFFDDKTDIIIISATVIGLLLIGMGIGIKFYLDKVINSIDTKCRSVYKQIKFKKKKKNELEKLLNGDPGRIDPDVPMECQTEFLPYDKKWEFPRKRLRLGLLLFLFSH